MNAQGVWDPYRGRHFDFIEVLMKGLRVMALREMRDKYDILGTHFFNYGQLKPGIAPHPSQSEGWWGG